MCSDIHHCKLFWNYANILLNSERGKRGMCVALTVT